MTEQVDVQEYECAATQSTIRRILRGTVTLVECMEQKRYIIPQYPVYCVDLLHIKIRDKGGSHFDGFIETK